MFITPAMASEPYWAAAPSRSTSIRSIAAAGIAFRSTPTVPRPNVPLTCTNALEWRRLPLTRTSTWSGPRPRRLAGLMWSEPSAMVWCDALNDGASVARIWFTSVWPVSCTACDVITSTGTGVSTAVRDVRAPTTTISLRARGVAVSLKSTVTVCPAGTTTRCSAASCPMSRARLGCHHGPGHGAGLLCDQRDHGDDEEGRDAQWKHGGRSHGPPPGEPSNKARPAGALSGAFPGRIADRP